jgi:hypothetical protein
VTGGKGLRCKQCHALLDPVLADPKNPLCFECRPLQARREKRRAKNGR